MVTILYVRAPPSRIYRAFEGGGSVIADGNNNNNNNCEYSLPPPQRPLVFDSQRVGVALSLTFLGARGNLSSVVSNSKGMNTNV